MALPAVKEAVSKGESHIVTLFTPKGCNITAQGNALGQVPPNPQRPNGAQLGDAAVVNDCSHPSCLYHQSIAESGGHHAKRAFKNEFRWPINEVGYGEKYISD
jgi:hypothetical protein